MSYLGYPRIHFAGSFQADVSTVNNDPTHFDSAAFLPRYQEWGRGESDGWWNPRGTGAWRLRGCEVSSVLSAEGVTAVDAAATATLEAADDRVSAKLVDLDPEQQMVSTVFGLRLMLRFADGSTGFAGDFLPAPFSDIWPRFPEGHPDSFFGATYQSVIAVDEWGETDDSPVLQELRQACAGEMLSIKFNVDGCDTDITSPNFTWGRIVGAIGPYGEGEPRHFVAGRLLRPAAAASFNPAPAPARLDDAAETLFVDLGNSLPTASEGGPIQDVGPLHLAALPADGAPVFLGSIEPAGSAFYRTQAGIMSLKLTPAQMDAAREIPLALLDASGNIFLQERPDGGYLRADEFVFRMSPGDTATTTLYALRFGQAAAGVEIKTNYEDSAMVGQVIQGGTGPDVGTPQSALSFASSLTTGPQGTAELSLKASDPGNPRGYIDGQLYGVGYGWGDDFSVPQGNVLSVHVYDAFAAPQAPTWIADIQPLLQPYANLYPAMSAIVDLSNYSHVVRHKRALELAMSLPITDPNYMPVTRDLSPAKSAMVMRWLKEPEPPLFRIDDMASLRQVVQLAIELEHATIPPYLCALWSLIPGCNTQAAEIIFSVVMEEMLHLALACNLLNALGGHPAIAKPGFVPRYPGHLPGGLRPDLTVSLRRCSKEHVRDVFMSIEQPSETSIPDGVAVESVVDTRGIIVDEDGRIATPEAADTAAAELERHFRYVEHAPLTIGWFYKHIGKAICELCDKHRDIFTGDPALQMTPKIYAGAPGRVYVIRDKRAALLALHEIEVQGEGTPATDPSGGRDELAHYYRFQEIVEGRQLIETAPGKWAFEGPLLPFDAAGVLPMIDNPGTHSLPPGSQVSSTAEIFDSVYGALLRALDETFNGSPTTLGTAVGLMFSLKGQAQKLMTMPVTPGSAETAGPAFQPS